MGSIRTWSLAAVAGIFVVVVAHQRSNADVGPASRAGCRGRVPAEPCAGRPGDRIARFLRAWSPENGAAVVNISVVEKPQKFPER